MEFLPDYGQASVGSKYIGLYRLFTNQSWRTVCDPGTKKAARFDTALQAVNAAKDFVKAKLNPKIRSDRVDEHDADILGIAEWMENKHAGFAETQLIKRTRKLKPFTVERKSKGKAVGKSRV